LENRTINAVRIACSTAGSFAYGKVNPVTNTYTKIGSITLANASSSTPNFKVYTFDPFVLEKDEQMWFCDANSSGYFWYQQNTSVGNFGSGVKQSNCTPSSTMEANLCIDVGYVVSE
jgi:hypothetical protein